VKMNKIVKFFVNLASCGC